MRPGTLTRQFLRHTGPLTGAWEDVGEGSCLHCKGTRRLYKPLVCPEVTVCATCAQIFSKVSLGLFNREGEIEVDHEVPAKAKKARIEVETDDLIEEECFTLVDGRLDRVHRRVAQRAASRRRLQSRPLPLRHRGRLH